ncbi:hypothetical protein LMH87_006179 [Akanthomyces muscarius]|uniref:Uncharacterized protein n=1 Tax=Akanthomyces muscarius TaxID=2231603 RepID=A0A9W8QQM5_AKAMU|nr:hypothetical protein LMH87_006179 [Akanthomyces muscarius]KAJ4164507.1 hypothetical protein LMH87_006179 [Akanthomyces muscarius]
MVSNKNRLYVALYPSGVANNDERKYHWGFIIGPKNESKEEVRGLRCNVRNYPLRGWTYEETKLQNVKSTNNLLARIRVAKIEDEKRLLEILRETPLVQDDPEFRCRTWMADVLSRIANSESFRSWNLRAGLEQDRAKGETLRGEEGCIREILGGRPGIRV